jgi:hypothetical protein
VVITNFVNDYTQKRTELRTEIVNDATAKVQSIDNDITKAQADGNTELATKLNADRTQFINETNTKLQQFDKETQDKVRDVVQNKISKKYMTTVDSRHPSETAIITETANQLRGNPQSQKYQTGTPTKWKGVVLPL